MSSRRADVLHLLERDIPESRRHLQDSHNNLEKVAAYCEGNYVQAPDRRHALEETKNYTTQSLASVAYQINTLANNFIMLLDLQLNQLADMESSINHLSQTVMIHKEKVARREIGVLTTNKATARPAGVKNPGIIFPDQQEKPVKYTRKVIDYSILDDIGHGVKTQQQNPRTRRTSASGTKSASQAPTTKPPTPPSGTYRVAGGTLGRQSSSPYHSTAPMVAPPAVPSNYGPGGYGRGPGQVQIQAGPGEKRSGYASVLAGQAPPSTPPPPPPPMGMVPPMSHQMPHSMAGVMSGQGAPPTPPPPSVATPGPAVAETGSRRSYEEPLPPPLPESPYQMLSMGNVSPPLPPPPDQDGGYGQQFGGPPPPVFSSGPHDVDYGMGRFGGPLQPATRAEDTSVPDKYIEKVVAIYDYVKDKDDELSFSEGAVIYVIRKNDDGWWEGTLDGTTGLFPGNYVEPCI